MRQFTVKKGQDYHVILPMFVNMRQPHVIVTRGREQRARRPTTARGSVGGGACVLRYGKIDRDSVIMRGALRDGKQ